MSVDTNTKNKNLANYRRVRHPDFKILITPHLAGAATSMRIETRGGIRKKFVIEFDDGSGGCSIDSGDSNAGCADSAADGGTDGI